MRLFANLTAAASLSLAMWPALPVTADTLGAPTGEVILRVEGAVANTNADGAAMLDLAALQAMPATEFETTTIWTDGPQTFTGVALVDLIEGLGLEGEMLRAVALNDYAVEIPFSDAVDGGPIVAYHQNGEEMSRRDKGPLWIVYPYDANADYQSETIYSRSIWQLSRIETLE